MVEWLLISGAIATAFVAVVRGLQLAWKTLRGWHHTILHLSISMDAIRDLTEAQLTRNGGGSLVDRVNEIPHIRRSLDEQGSVLTRVETRVDRIEACLKKIHQEQASG